MTKVSPQYPTNQPKSPKVSQKYPKFILKNIQKVFKNYPNSIQEVS